MGARLDILPISFSLLWHNRYVESSRLSLTPCVLAIHFLTSCSPHSDCMSMPVGTWFRIVTSSFLVANPENASQVSPTSDLRTDSWDKGLALQRSLLLTLAACQVLSFPLTPQCLLRPWFRNSSLFWPEMCDFFPSTLSFSPHSAHPMRVRSSTPRQVLLFLWCTPLSGVSQASSQRHHSHDLNLSPHWVSLYWTMADNCS